MGKPRATRKLMERPRPRHRFLLVETGLRLFEARAKPEPWLQLKRQGSEITALLTPQLYLTLRDEVTAIVGNLKLKKVRKVDNERPTSLLTGAKIIKDRHFSASQKMKALLDEEDDDDDEDDEEEEDGDGDEEEEDDFVVQTPEEEEQTEEDSTDTEPEPRDPYELRSRGPTRAPTNATALADDDSEDEITITRPKNPKRKRILSTDDEDSDVSATKESVGAAEMSRLDEYKRSRILSLEDVDSDLPPPTQGEKVAPNRPSQSTQARRPMAEPCYIPFVDRSECAESLTDVLNRNLYVPGGLYITDCVARVQKLCTHDLKVYIWLEDEAYPSAETQLIIDAFRAPHLMQAPLQGQLIQVSGARLYGNACLYGGCVRRLH